MNTTTLMLRAALLSTLRGGCHGGKLLCYRRSRQILNLPGSVQSKFVQIGNAVPPKLMKAMVLGIVSGEGLSTDPTKEMIGALWAHNQDKPIPLCS